MGGVVEGRASSVILKRASGFPSSGEWNDDDLDVRADGAIVGPITASEFEAHDRGGSKQHSALLEREDYSPVTWYRSLHAPRTGGAYDSHHRTAGVAGRGRRRGGGVAARGTGAAGNALDRLSPQCLFRGIRLDDLRVQRWTQRNRLCPETQRSDRVSLGR